MLFQQQRQHHIAKKLGVLTNTKSEPKTCKSCLGEFYPKRADSLYCTKNCRIVFHNKNRLKVVEQVKQQQIGVQSQVNPQVKPEQEFTNNVLSEPPVDVPHLKPTTSLHDLKSSKQGVISSIVKPLQSKIKQVPIEIVDNTRNNGMNNKSLRGGSPKMFIDQEGPMFLPIDQQELLAKQQFLGRGGGFYMPKISSHPNNKFWLTPSPSTFSRGPTPLTNPHLQQYDASNNYSPQAFNSSRVEWPSPFGFGRSFTTLPNKLHHNTPRFTPRYTNTRHPPIEQQQQENGPTLPENLFPTTLNKIQ